MRVCLTWISLSSCVYENVSELVAIKYFCMLPRASTSFTMCDVSEEVGGDAVIFSQADVVMSLQLNIFRYQYLRQFPKAIHLRCIGKIKCYVLINLFMSYVLGCHCLSWTFWHIINCKKYNFWNCIFRLTKRLLLFWLKLEQCSNL